MGFIGFHESGAIKKIVKLINGVEGNKKKLNKVDYALCIYFIYRFVLFFKERRKNKMRDGRRDVWIILKRSFNWSPANIKLFYKFSDINAVTPCGYLDTGP